MEKTIYVIKIFSTLSAAIPLGIGFLTLRRGLPVFWYFLAFLGIGCFVDLFGWYNYHFTNYHINASISKIYRLLELTFYSWLLCWATKIKVVKVVCKLVFLNLGLLWVAHLFEPFLVEALYLFSCVLYLFIANFVLIELIESLKGDGLPLVFWLVFGIFFYNCCLLLILAMNSTEFDLQIKLRVAPYITTNIIYAVGFWVCRDEFAAAKVERQTLSNS